MAATFAWKSALRVEDRPTDSQQAMGRYFRYAPQHQTVPEMAAMYRKLKMGFVVFPVDGEKGASRGITNEEDALMATALGADAVGAPAFVLEHAADPGGIARRQSGSPIAVTQATNLNAFAGFGVQVEERDLDAALRQAARESSLVKNPFPDAVARFRTVRPDLPGRVSVVATIEGRGLTPTAPWTCVTMGTGPV